MQRNDSIYLFIEYLKDSNINYLELHGKYKDLQAINSTGMCYCIIIVK